MTMQEIINELNRAVFIKNAMLTLIIQFNFRLPLVLKTLIKEDKNNYRSSYLTKQSFLEYLRS